MTKLSTPKAVPSTNIDDREPACPLPQAAGAGVSSPCSLGLYFLSSSHYHFCMHVLQMWTNACSYVPAGHSLILATQHRIVCLTVCICHLSLIRLFVKASFYIESKRWRGGATVPMQKRDVTFFTEYRAAVGEHMHGYGIGWQEITQGILATDCRRHGCNEKSLVRITFFIDYLD